MKTLKRSTLISTLTLTLALTLALSASEAEARTPTGFWSCAIQGRSLPLVMLPNGRLSFNNVGAAYRALPGALMVQQQGMWMRYGYRVSGRSMSVTLPGGRGTMRCRAIPAGRERLLRGTFCRWSGGSSSYAGTASSRSTRVTFDGRGGLSFASEASYSGNSSGGYYSRTAPRRGTYRVVGKQVIVVLANGDGALALIHMQQAGGRITELKYNGSIYSPTLCK